MFVSLEVFDLMAWEKLDFIMGTLVAIEVNVFGQ